MSEKKQLGYMRVLIVVFIVISAVIALPEGEKLKLPVSASCASSAEIPPEDLRAKLG